MLKNNRGFTLVEMLVVMLIITVLLLLIIPNITKQTDNVHSKGCDALVSVVQAQTDAYHLEFGTYPSTIEELENKGYIESEQTKCHNDQQLTINTEGTISVKNE